jgi:hypothetical protein
MRLRKAKKGQIKQPDPKIARGVRTPVPKDRLRELVAAGFNEGVLKAFVDAFAHASNERKPAIAGMKKRQIIGLVHRICRVASQIIAVNDKVSRGSGRPVSEGQGAHLPVELGLVCNVASLFVENAAGASGERPPTA